MKTRNLGIVMDEGADFSLIIGIFGDTGPIDITGYSFKSEMKTSTDPDADTVAEFEFEILDQSKNKGQVRWFMPEASISSVITSISTSNQNRRVTTPFIFDVKMSDTVGNVSRIVQGVIHLSPEATQESF